MASGLWAKFDRNKAERRREWREAVLARDGFRCLASFDARCTGNAEHAHHVIPRGRGGQDALENGLSVCFYCHRKIHDYPQAATARGLLASLGADLAAVTELRRNGGIR